MQEVNAGAFYKSNFVDAGALAVAIEVSEERPLLGIQLLTPMNIVLLDKGKYRYSVGPTSHLIAVNFQKTVATVVFLSPKDDFIPVANCRGSHVDLHNRRITSIGLPCSVPAFRLFYGGELSATAAEPRYTSVEISAGA